MLEVRGAPVARVQATYFATVPRGHLDLLLRIEADRLAPLKLPATALQVEQGSMKRPSDEHLHCIQPIYGGGSGFNQ